MECKISIIIPVYNVEKYIERCLESILNQAFNEICEEMREALNKVEKEQA